MYSQVKNILFIKKGYFMFSKRLRESRLNAQLTQQDMANIIGCTLNSYQKYEQGERFPSSEILVLLANKLDVSIDWLLCRDKWLEAHFGVPR